MRSFRPYFSLGKCFLALAGSAILAFGLYNVHSFSNVTEGGVLGMTLLLHHWFGLSPSISGLVLNAACYIGGWRTLGRSFIFYSVIAGGGFSAFYAFFERFDPLWPGLAQMPLVAAVVGALFVGVGAGLSVRAGGAPGGDDALAMALHPEEAARTASLTQTQALAYQAGETLSLGDLPGGYTLLCCEGVSLGWGKQAGGLMKNHYPKGLRRR